MIPRAQVINLDALALLRRGVASVTTLDFTPLMIRWEYVIVEDNRKGVLEGTDGWGRPMPPLVYRNGAGQRTAARKGEARGTTEKRFKGRSGYTFFNPKFHERPFPGVKRARRPGDPNRQPHQPQGGPRQPRQPGAVILANNNLSTAAYQRLTGPRLAPRRTASRVIANFESRHGRDASGWFAEGGWDNNEIVDAAGRPFLLHHFDGTGRSPRYDLRHVRPWGMTEAGRELRSFVRGALFRLKSAGQFATGWTQYRTK